MEKSRAEPTVSRPVRARPTSSSRPTCPFEKGYSDDERVISNSCPRLLSDVKPTCGRP